MTILCVGIDLAKNVFALHGVSEAGKAEHVPSAAPRAKLHELIASLPCVIGMEASSGALHGRAWQACRASHHEDLKPRLQAQRQRGARPAGCARPQRV